MTLEEFSNLVAGKWIADNTFGNEYEPVECAGALPAGNGVYFVMRGPDQSIAIVSAVAFNREIIHMTREACQAECDRLNKPADTYDEAEDEEEAA